MPYWITDPELFLYVKGTGPDDVHLWRCKKPASSLSTSSLVVPMKPDDFDFVKIVENHLELIGYMDVWDEPDYNRLVKYIYEKRFLVNIQGFVIAELLHKADKDGNKTIVDANEEDVPAIYIRSLDVLPLKHYIPNLSEQPIPLRTVKYLGDANGKVAMMEEDSNVTKLTARVADLESKNKTLDTNVTKLTAENKTMEGKVTKLTADLVTQMTALTNLQQEVKNINANRKEVWMNDLTNSEWVGIGAIQKLGVIHSLIIIGGLGTYTVDDSSTNVRARYWYKIKIHASSGEYKAVSLEDLTPNKEMGRFSQAKDRSFESNGKTYVCWS